MLKITEKYELIAEKMGVIWSEEIIKFSGQIMHLKSWIFY